MKLLKAHVVSPGLGRKGVGEGLDPALSEVWESSWGSAGFSWLAALGVCLPKGGMWLKSVCCPSQSLFAVYKPLHNEGYRDLETSVAFHARERGFQRAGPAAGCSASPSCFSSMFGFPLGKRPHSRVSQRQLPVPEHGWELLARGCRADVGAEVGQVWWFLTL